MATALQTLKSLFKPFQSTEQKGIYGGSIWSIEESPKITYSTLVDIYEKDGVAGFVIDGTVKAALGIGYHYRHDGTPEGEEQVKLLEDFNNSRYVMMRAKNIEIGTAMYAYGFCPVEPKAPEMLTEISTLPLRANWSWKRNGSRIEYIRERYNGGDVIFNVDEMEIIPFTMNANADNPLGRGILHRLAETSDYKIQYSNGESKKMTRFSLYRAKQMLLHDLVKLVHNGVPKSLWKVTVKNEDAQRIANIIETLDPGQRLFTNAKETDIKTEMTDVRNGFRQIVDTFNNDYMTALQSFLPKFFGDAAWTEASATVAERIWYNALVHNLQESFADTKIHLIDDVILKQHGFDQNHTKYYWGMPKGPEIQPEIIPKVMAQVVSFAQAGVIDGDYALSIFNQLLDMLGQMGIAIDTKAVTVGKLGETLSKMAKDMLDGQITIDSRRVAEQYLKEIEERKIRDPVVPRRIR